MRNFMVVVSVTLGVVNIALFGLWWSLVRIEALPPQEGSQLVLNAISVQIAVLQTVMAGVAIALGILAVWGYQSIKEVAVNEAVKRSLIELQASLNTFKTDLAPRGPISPEAVTPPPASDVQIEPEGGNV